MLLKTSARSLSDTIGGISGGADIGEVGDEYRPALAQAFNALTRLVEVSGSDVTLLCDLNDDAVTLSIATGKASEALRPDAPYENPHLSVIDHERQAKAKAKKAEVEAARKAAEKAEVRKPLGAGGRIR